MPILTPRTPTVGSAWKPKRNVRPLNPMTAGKTIMGHPRRWKPLWRLDRLGEKKEYSVSIGDDDAAVISKFRKEVHSGIQKWSDVNHVTCTMTKALYEGRRTNFAANSEKLTDKVIENIKTCFTYALYQNRSLSSSIKPIVPHCFGDHAQCGVWCRYSDDAEGYRHSTLPGQKDL